MAVVVEVHGDEAKPLLVDLAGDVGGAFVGEVEPPFSHEEVAFDPDAIDDADGDAAFVAGCEGVLVEEGEGEGAYAGYAVLGAGEEAAVPGGCENAEGGQDSAPGFKDRLFLINWCVISCYGHRRLTLDILR
ncbi:hypothetical protein [Streptomyces noursei]